MDDLGIGKIITGGAQRDAIHVAVAPVVAGKRLYPGQHVGIADGVAVDVPPFLGIVDPFLGGPVFPEQRFWLCLYPGSITSLRHHWEHPALREDDRTNGGPSSAETLDRAASMAWLKDYADELDLDLDELMDGARDYVVRGNRLVGSDNLEGVWTKDEFWDHYEIVTGTTVPRNRRHNFFSCSC